MKPAVRIAVALLIGLALGLIIGWGTADAHHGKGCHTTACRDRTAKWNVSVASVYDGVGLGGRVACKGYWPGGYVLAHKTLPCGTKVRLGYRGRKVTARVWDRGPFVAGRDFDLDVAVQRRLGFPWGVAAVRWRVVH